MFPTPAQGGLTFKKTDTVNMTYQGEPDLMLICHTSRLERGVSVGTVEIAVTSLDFDDL